MSHPRGRSPAGGPEPIDTGTHLRLALHVPRRAQRVSVVRHLLRQGLVGIGVIDGCRDDILLAVAETYSKTEYYVVATIDRELCVVDGIDRGVGADPARLRAMSQRMSQRGRGLRMIRAVADALDLHSVAMAMIDPAAAHSAVTAAARFARGPPSSSEPAGGDGTTSASLRRGLSFGGETRGCFRSSAWRQRGRQQRRPTHPYLVLPPQLREGLACEHITDTRACPPSGSPGRRVGRRLDPGECGTGRREPARSHV
jgi:hypothetical protein